jgi:hypothetical protein
MSRFTKRHASALPGVPTVGRAFAGGPTQAHPGGNTVAAKTRRTSGRVACLSRALGEEISQFGKDLRWLLPRRSVGGDCSRNLA